MPNSESSLDLAGLKRSHDLNQDLKEDTMGEE
jgi:hypothetical protein